MDSDGAAQTWKGMIESLALDGSGIGSMQERTRDGKPVRRPVFVAYAAPGDSVEARIVARKGKYVFGELTRIIEPSPHRETPPCPHFGVCGGCDLEHVAYDEQLRQKAKGIAHQIAKAGVQLPHPVTVLPSKQRYQYRKRGRIAVRFSGGKATAGFRRRRSREIIPIATCWIVDPAILRLIVAINDEASIPAPLDLDGQEIEVLTVIGEKGKLGIFVRLDDLPPPNRSAVREWIEQVYAKGRKLIGNVLIEEDGQTRALGQVQEHFSYTIDGMTLGFSPETFIQANIATDETLIEQAMRMLTRGEATTDMNVIDLYGGIGNLTLPAARRCAQVVGVEGHEASVHAARANLIRNAITNAAMIHHPTEAYLKEWLRAHAGETADARYPAADAIIVDPPRTGLSETACALLKRTGVGRIIYVSCDAQTLARDLRELAGAYRLADIVGIDMFPDISHVEIVCFLERTV